MKSRDITGVTGVPELTWCYNRNIVEFWSWCGQMDLASAYVLHPLNRLVLDVMAWDRGWVNEQRSGSIPDRRCRRGLKSEGRGQGRKLIGVNVANGLGLRGSNIVDI